MFKKLLTLMGTLVFVVACSGPKEEAAATVDADAMQETQMLETMEPMQSESMDATSSESTETAN